MIDRKRTKDQVIYHTENCGICADAEGKREDRDGGETGGLEKYAECVARVLHERFEEMSAQDFARFLFILLIAAKFHARTALGFRARDTRALEIVGAVLDVRAKFLVHLGVEAGAIKENCGERAKRGEEFHTSSGCVPRTEAIADTRRFQPSASSRKRLRPAEVSS